MELKDRRLLRSTHRTFEEYCRIRPTALLKTEDALLGRASYGRR